MTAAPAVLRRHPAYVQVSAPRLLCMASTTTGASTQTRQLLNKVPEVTVYFWIIKILCTTVGESVADYINETLGFGLTNTTTARIPSLHHPPSAESGLLRQRGSRVDHLAVQDRVRPTQRLWWNRAISETSAKSVGQRVVSTTAASWRRPKTFHPPTGINNYLTVGVLESSDRA
jgi:hypothetical protein